MKNTTFKQQVRYKFDTFIAKGGANIFISLFFVFMGLLLAIALLRGILLIATPEGVGYDASNEPIENYNRSFFRQVYLVFLEMTDPGNMNIDELKSILDQWPYSRFALPIA